MNNYYKIYFTTPGYEATSGVDCHYSQGLTKDEAWDNLRNYWKNHDGIDCHADRLATFKSFWHIQIDKLSEELKDTKMYSCIYTCG